MLKRKDPDHLSEIVAYILSGILIIIIILMAISIVQMLFV